jgi:predicted TIM-barrel fold metal-dependent hydrolase
MQTLLRWTGRSSSSLETVESTLRAMDEGNVDTSAYVLHRLPPGFVDWMKGVGASRVMFGTNWPMLSPAKCLAGLTRLELSSDQQVAFLRGNASRVFGLQSSS